jgi:hypothetical protein
MAGMFGRLLNDELAQLIAQLRQLVERQLAQIFGGFDGVKVPHSYTVIIF